MKTTSVVIEILIIGLQTIMWLALIVLSVFGYRWVRIDSGLLLALTLFVTAISYTLGVLFDNLWNRLSKIIDEPIRLKFFSVSEEAHSTRINVLFNNKNAVEFMEYIRSRMRIARASFYNFFLITICALIFITTQLQWVAAELRIKLITFVIISGVLLTVLALSTYRKIVHTYYKQISIIYKELVTKR